MSHGATSRLGMRLVIAARCDVELCPARRFRDARPRVWPGWAWRYVTIWGVEPYAVTDPFDGRLLDVGDGHLVCWERARNPAGKSAVLVRGGPAASVTSPARRMLDSQRYLIVQFDQRQCGLGTPPASQTSAASTGRRSPLCGPTSSRAGRGPMAAASVGEQAERARPSSRRGRGTACRGMCRLPQAVRIRASPGCSSRVVPEAVDPLIAGVGIHRVGRRPRRGGRDRPRPPRAGRFLIPVVPAAGTNRPLSCLGSGRSIGRILGNFGPRVRGGDP